METLNKKIKNEDELLGLFIDLDGIHSSTWMPFLHPTYNEVWATDGYVIIRIPPERLNKQYEPTDGCEKLKLPMVEHPCSKSCTLADINKALDSCPLVDEVLIEENEEKCKECDGTGEVKWEYTDDNLHRHFHNFDCPVCGGSGVITSKKEIHTGKKVHDENAIVKIGNATFLWYYLDIVAKALKHIGADVIDITANDHLGTTMFVFDGIKIGLASYNNEGRRYNAEVELSKNDSLNNNDKGKEY